MVLVQRWTQTIRLKCVQHTGTGKGWDVHGDAPGHPVQLPDNNYFLKCVFWRYASPDFMYKRWERATMNFGMYQTLMEVITFYICTCKKTLSLRDDSNAQVTSCLRSFMNQSFNLIQENSKSESPTNIYCACFGSLNNGNIYTNEQVTFCAQCHHNDMENFYSLSIGVKSLLTHLGIAYSCWLQWNRAGPWLTWR